MTMSELESPITHRSPRGVSDRMAYFFAHTVHILADNFFAKQYGHRAVVLETVAAVPGMVAALFLHLRSLRRIEDDKGRIVNLLAEAENERMHLMVYVSVAEPSFVERVIIVCAQITFFVGYFLVYLLSPRTAHRFIGYLEEEAIQSYSAYLHEVDEGTIKNIPAPPLAISYWNLPPDATLRDVILATRGDEMRHRDLNHRFASEMSAP